MTDRSIITKEEVARGYDAIVEHVGLEPRFYDDCIAFHSSYAGNILDVGCGRGFLLKKLKAVAEDGTQLYGLDISPKLVEIAKSNVPDAQIVVGDAEALPYENGMFDTIFMTEALEHMLDFKKALSEIARVLKPGGTFIVTVPNRDWASYEFYDKIRNHNLQPVDDHYFRYSEIASLLTDAGLIIKRERGLDNLFYYGWKHKLEEFAAVFFPSLNRKMKRLIFKCIKET